MGEFEQLARFRSHLDLHASFRSGELVQSWADSYPMLFDDDDLRIAKSQAHMGYHFYEWLAAILIYHNYGHLSLVEQYEFEPHQRKQEVLGMLAAPDVIEFITHRKNHGRVQCPDLLVYWPDYSDWYFCEVKGPRDQLRSEQRELFRDLAEISGKPVKVVEIEELSNVGSAG